MVTAPLVRAIRRAMRPRSQHSEYRSSGYDDMPGLVAFRVENIFEFAAWLLEEGVTVNEEEAA